MPRRRRRKITRKDLKLFAIMCLIALVVGAGIALVDEKSRSFLESFNEDAVAEFREQARIEIQKEIEKRKAEQAAKNSPAR